MLHRAAQQIQRLTPLSEQRGALLNAALFVLFWRGVVASCWLPVHSTCGLGLLILQDSPVKDIVPLVCCTTIQLLKTFSWHRNLRQLHTSERKQLVLELKRSLLDDAHSSAKYKTSYGMHSMCIVDILSMDKITVQQEACGDAQQRIAADADSKVKAKLSTAQIALWNAMQA
jgi:hypothetical protein